MKMTLKMSALAIVCVSITACGNLSNVSNNGTTDSPIFPKIEQSTFNHDGTQYGTWPNWDNVRMIERGMSKDQIRHLIGNPHFGEGLYGVREFDYVFNYRENGEHKICQYKVLFDDKMQAQTFLWYPNGCNSSHTFNMNTDLLFDFDKYELTSQGKQVVAELAKSLNALSIKSIVIGGHTDRLGSVKYNLDLSKRRAESVKAQLQHLGVNAEIKTIGFGKAHQVKHCDGNDQVAKDCLRPNRRVVVKTFASKMINEQQAGIIGPAPLYDSNYPYSPNVSGNPYPTNVRYSTESLLKKYEL
ncbi:OmpA family protein [Pasteurella multocida]|uniref:OmpA family protein n=1 Tax=Pasteurella multocida TaxID=747 RepID=UPI0030D401E7